MQSVSNSLLPCGISLKIIIINNLVIPNLIEICVSSLELSAYLLDSLMRKYRINIIKLVVEVNKGFIRSEVLKVELLMLYLG